MKRIVTTLLALTLVGALAAACAGETTGTIGSETNWLARCSNDADCATGSCLCGICTDECTSDTSCDNELCLGSESRLFGRVCLEAGSAPEGLCVPRCESSADCPQGGACESGTCVPKPPTDELAAPCVLPMEEDPSYAGSSVDQVTVEDRYPGCTGGFCVQYHFQGRVSCPYGEDCETADGQTVVVDVEPQLLERAAEDAVFCSCPCDGPAGSGPFCECPGGFSCEQLLEDLDVDGPFPTHYCVKPGTVLEPDYTPDSSATCDPSLGNCESRLCNPTTCTAGNHCEGGVCVPDPSPPPPGSPPPCDADEKLCVHPASGEEQCFALIWPQFSCAEANTCAPCAPLHATESRCTANGLCDYVACEPGFDDCNANGRDGCERAVHSDPENCGECSQRCNLPRVAEHACVNGVCRVTTCDAGWSNCDFQNTNGCECAGVCNGADHCEPDPGEGGAGGMSGAAGETGAGGAP